ncbi:MAG: SDR family oxidoreductase [Roseiflexaceae bacterium]
MTSALKVLVYGATGAQARPTVYELLAAGHRPVVLSRNQAKAADLVAAGAVLAEGDLGDLASLKAAHAGVDAVAFMIPAFLENPFAARSYAQHAIAAAREAGVRMLVWNTSGPVPPVRTNNPMNDLRIDIAADLEASGVPYIILEPTAYMENWLGPWTSRYVTEHNQVAYPLPAQKRMGWITSDDIGKLVVSALARPHLAGRHFRVSGIEVVTGPELAEQFAAALNRPLSYYAMPPEEMGAIMDQLLGPGAGAPVVEVYRAEYTNPEALRFYHDMTEVLTVLPVQMTTIQQWVQKYAAAFQPRNG